MELGEGERDLMKMLMQNDPPEETIQRPMEDPAMVQSGVRKDQILYFVGPVISHHASYSLGACAISLNNTIFHAVNQDGLFKKTLCFRGKGNATSLKKVAPYCTM